MVVHKQYRTDTLQNISINRKVNDNTIRVYPVNILVCVQSHLNKDVPKPRSHQSMTGALVGL